MKTLFLLTTVLAAAAVLASGAIAANNTGPTSLAVSKPRPVAGLSWLCRNGYGYGTFGMGCRKLARMATKQR